MGQNLADPKNFGLKKSLQVGGVMFSWKFLIIQLLSTKFHDFKKIVGSSVHVILDSIHKTLDSIHKIMDSIHDNMSNMFNYIVCEVIKCICVMLCLKCNICHWWYVFYSYTILTYHYIHIVMDTIHYLVDSIHVFLDRVDPVSWILSKITWTLEPKIF